MNRLTECDDLGNWELKGVRWQQLYVGQVISREVHEKIYGALHKLMEYEETGLAPEQLEEIDVLYAEKCKELAECKKLLEVYAKAAAEHRGPTRAEKHREALKENGFPEPKPYIHCSVGFPYCVDRSCAKCAEYWKEVAE